MRRFRRWLALFLVALMPLGSGAMPLRMDCHGTVTQRVAPPSHCAKHEKKSPALLVHCHCPLSGMSAALPDGAPRLVLARTLPPINAPISGYLAQTGPPAPYRPPIHVLAA